MSHVDTVRGIYESFSRGDVPAVLASISDDVRWEHWPANTAQAHGVPYLQAGRGKEGVGAFFASLAAIEMHDLQVLGYLEGGSFVTAIVEIEFTVRATGKRLRDQELHLWTLDAGGQVIAMRHYVDTAKHIEANRAG
jgi:ketosteroid isomerase-like protein